VSGPKLILEGDRPPARRWYCPHEGPVLLADGRVLAAGGTDERLHPAADAALYDPAIGTWSPTGSMTVPRNLHTATRLADGRVLVAGGGGGAGGTAELYDPATGTWTATGKLNHARSTHAAALLPSGKVLVSGGEGSRTLRECETYDPATGTWTTVAPMTDPRSDHTIVSLHDGTVLAVGGNRHIGQYQYIPTALCEIFREGVGWAFAESLRVPRRFHEATVLADGTVLATGGGGPTPLIDGLFNPLSVWAVERYDPLRRTWSVDSALPWGRAYHRAVPLPSGRLLVIGGMEPANPNVGYQNATIYDPVSGTWTASGGMSVGRWAFGATPLADGRVLVVGGTVRSGVATTTPGTDVLTATAEVFTP
jgi:hypothetical protein